MQITLRVGNDVAHAELEDTAATREFVAMLPLTAKFEDFASAEKISYLPRKLNVAGAGPAGPAQRWDLMYYVPWGNLAVFYRGYSPSPDLLRLGRIVSGTDVLTRTSSFTATIERVED